MVPDINALELSQEVVEVNGQLSNPEEFFKLKLPDDGEHVGLLSLGDRGVKISRQKDSNGVANGAAFLNVHLAIQLVGDSGEKAGSCLDNPTSIVMQSAGTSKLHAILGLAGAEVQPRMTIGDLKELTENTLAQSPRVKVITQWEAQAKAESLEEVQKSGVKKLGDYYTIAKGQKKFPPLVDDSGNQIPGKFNSEILNPITGDNVQAQVRVVRYSRA
jgi:hypothetical protein